MCECKARVKTLVVLLRVNETLLSQARDRRHSDGCLSYFLLWAASKVGPE